VAFSTSDLCDEFGNEVQVAEPVFRDFGGVRRFAGPIETVRVEDDNALIREALIRPGQGRVLVVDGGASLRCALLGGKLAELARSNGWRGLIVNGCIRDCSEVAVIDIGVKALHTSPRRSDKTGAGQQGVALRFAGVSFAPGAYLYTDEDGLIVADRDLLKP
jgi:regulator of ribonuclease activity A